MSAAAARLSPSVLAKTACAMLAFASNSLLCRFALRDGAIDAGSFTAIRLTAGALVMVPLLASREIRSAGAGSWGSAAALFAYAAAFSFAYVRVSAGTGAIVLFFAVQSTMVIAGLRRGEALTQRRLLGFAVAAAGLLALTLPGAGAPDPIGVALMAVSGSAWGIYSLRGAGTATPVAATLGNFMRTVPLALALAIAAHGFAHVTPRGALIAAVSGGFASALGYIVWYGALRHLLAIEAALVQLSVPVLAAIAGVLLLGETMTPRAIAAGAAILTGIGIGLKPRA